MATKTRILIVSDSHVLPTRLAEVTRLIFTSLLDRYPEQYEVHQIGLFHCHAVVPQRWPIYPTKVRKKRGMVVGLLEEDLYGQRTFSEVLDSLKPHIVFAYNSPSKVLYLCHPPDQRLHKLVLYLIYDGLPISPRHGQILNAADLIITESEFSKNVAIGCQPDVEPGKVRFMYGPADTTRFFPLPEDSKGELRRDLFPTWIPSDAFVLGWVGTNLWRKQIWIMYKVIHLLRTGHYLICSSCNRVSLFSIDPARPWHLDEDTQILEPSMNDDVSRCFHCNSGKLVRADPLSDVFLWLHMARDDPRSQWPLERLEQQFAAFPGRDIHYTEGLSTFRSLSPNDMPLLYQVWDCLLYLSGGEGFGRPAWEAMATALPVVYTNYSSHAEFLGKAMAGLAVGGTLQPEGYSCVWRMIADIGQAIEAIRVLYFDRSIGRTLGRNGRVFVSDYAIEKQVDLWHRILRDLQTESSS